MRKKVAIFSGLIVVGVAVGVIVYIGRPLSDLALLEPQKGVTVYSVEEALRKPVIDRVFPLIGQVTWPREVPKIPAIRNLAARLPNLAGVLFVDGSVLDLVPKLEVDGQELQMIDQYSFNPEMVALPKVYGTKPKDAILHYGDQPPIHLRLPANGRPAPWHGEKVIPLGGFTVHIVIAEISVPTELHDVTVKLEGGDPNVLYGLDLLNLGLPPAPIGKNPVERVISTYGSPQLPIAIHPITVTKIEVKAVVTVTATSRNFKLIAPDGSVWLEMEKETRQQWQRNLPKKSLIQIPGTPFGITAPDQPAQKTPTFDELWKASLAIKNGQKLPAISYTPQPAIAKGMFDTSFLDDAQSREH